MARTKPQELPKLRNGSAEAAIPAQLNMGDCFSYACAKLKGLPLLYKGDCFAQTHLA